MTQTVLERQAVLDASSDFIKRIAALTEATLDGLNNRETADLVFLCSMQASNAGREFFKRLSYAHADTMGLDADEVLESPLGGTYRPHGPSENIDDFADWAMKLAVDRNSPPVNTYYDAWNEHALGARQLVSVGFRHAAE